MHNSKIKRISLAVCLALMPIAASAAGLGKMTVMSGLGEPLSAEIEIAASKEELSSLTARIAPSEIYAEQSIERAASLSSVRVELTKRSDGTSVLKLSSPQPVNDPFLDMLIQVDWPTGRLLREYTALLDPPGYGDRAAASAQEAAVDGKQLPTVAAPTKKNAAKSVSRAVSAPKTEAAEATADTYVTKRGDTLRNVARQMQVDDVTLEQMLVGLFQANRSAFVADNMNQLKVGQIMRKPREEELRAISPQEALQEVRIHTSNWNAYRSDVAQAVAQSQGAPAESQPQSSGGKITAQAEDKAAPPPAGPRDVVKLSKSEATGAQKTAAAGTGSGVTDDKLRALEEESTSQDKAIAEVNERIAFFEKQIQDMQKLLLIQNQILAELQKGNAAGQPPAAEPAPAPAQPQDAQQPPAQAEQAKPEPAKPAPAPAPEEPAAGNLLDDLLQNPVMLGAAGGVLALLLGGWLLLRRQRQKNLDNFEKGILTSSGLKTDTVFGTTGGAAVDTGETSFMTDFAHRNGNGMIDTSDVDPISEAEVYMAYGRDAQAEEILKDAIAKEPKRYELHTKLLEIYANRKDATAFETLAGELYATLGTTDPVWGKVAELGRALEPENPMYASAVEPSGISTAGAVAAAGVVAAAVASAVPEAQAEESVAEESQDNSLDFDLGMLAADGSASEASLEKEIESAEPEPLPDLEAFSEPVAEEVAVSAEAPEEGMDLQFDLPEPAAAGVAQLDAADLGLPEEAAPAPAAEQVEEISFDLPELALDEVSAQVPDEASAIKKAEEESLAGDFSLPELAAVETAEEPLAEAVEEISFDLPELAPVSEEPAVEPEAAPEAGAPAVPEMEMPAFDLELPSESAAAPAEQAGEAVEAAEMPDFELPEIAQPEESAEMVAIGEAAVPAEAPVAEAVAEEVVFEEPVKEEESALDFNFSLDAEAEAPVEAAELPAAPIPDLDLSGISLDIAETSGDASETVAEEEITLSSGDESADVDTKLDLVTAYMDMGDSEGARELLEEVLQEGGPKQRERAQKMLDALT